MEKQNLIQVDVCKILKFHYIFQGKEFLNKFLNTSKGYFKKLFLKTRLEVQND